MPPLISIIVPVYNVQPYLRQCMEGLVGQTLREIEIICVDDGSTDGSSAILAEYAAKDERIRVITQENAGQSAARNAGLDAAAAPLIMFCDSDDWYAPVMCEKMYAAMQNGADMAVCGVQETTQEGNLSTTSDYFSLLGEGEITPSDDLFLRISVVPWNKIYRREIIESKQLRFPVILYFEDEYFYAVYTAYVKSLVFVPYRLSFYRQRVASVTGNAGRNPLNYAIKRAQIANQIWQYHEECQMVGRRLNYLIPLWLRLCAESMDRTRRPGQTMTIENLIVPFAKEHIIPHIARISPLQKKRLELLLKHRWIGTRRRLGGVLRLRTREKLDPDSCTIFYRYRLFGISCWKREKQYANRADKKKLLFCMSHFIMGGVEKVLCNYLMQMLKDGRYKCEVATLVPIHEPYFEAFFNKHGIKVHQFGYVVPPRRRRNFIARWVYKFRRVVTRYRRTISALKKLADEYDVLIDFANMNLSSYLRHIRGKRLIGFCHGSFPFFVQDTQKKDIRIYERIVCLSHAFENDFKKIYPYLAERISCIYNPIDVEYIQALARRSTPWEGKLYFVAVQRLCAEQKDVPTIIRGFCQFREKHQEYQLVIVGDGPQRNELQNLAAAELQQGHIIFLGQQDNPYPIIKHAQALLLATLPQVGEGFGQVIVEAQALGVAAVSSDVPSGPAEILMHGEAGYLFEAGNSESLAQVLEDIERHPEEREGKIRKATENLVRFSPSEAISRLEEIIQTADL